MKRENVPFVVLACVGGGLLLIHAFFSDYAWYAHTPLAWTNKLWTIDLGIPAAVFLLFIAAIGYTSMGEMRSLTDVIVAENRKLHYNMAEDALHRAPGGWGIIPYGGIRAWKMSMNGQEGIVVGPWEGIKSFGYTKILRGNLVAWDIDRLPRSVRDYVRDQGLPTKQVFLLVDVSKLDMRRPEFNRVMAQFASSNLIDSTSQRNNHILITSLERDNRRYAHMIDRNASRNRLSRLKSKFSASDDQQDEITPRV